MTARRAPRLLSFVACLSAAALTRSPALGAQRGGPTGPMREATRLDLDGRTADARAIIQSILDTVSDPLAKANVQRAMAMSYAFSGDCANTVRYEQMVIGYWTTRERAEPQSAFYQEGEMADEAARVCVDNGDLATAEAWYRKGYAYGVREPAPHTHPRTLWDFRLANALGRVAARRGDKAEAGAQIAAARRALDGDSTMAAQQERFFPYLVGYVALYTNDLPRAQSAFETMLAARENQNDPFMNCLLAITDERMGEHAAADSLYRKAYGLATAHNPPAAFVRPYVRKKLGLP